MRNHLASLDPFASQMLLRSRADMGKSSQDPSQAGVGNRRMKIVAGPGGVSPGAQADKPRQSAAGHSPGPSSCKVLPKGK